MTNTKKSINKKYQIIFDLDGVILNVKREYETILE